MNEWLSAVLNEHLMDELGHLVLQFPDALFINQVCWISRSGTNRLEALAIRLSHLLYNCFGGNPLMKLGQHLIDAGFGERDIPSNLQWKLKFAFFISLGTLSYIRVPTVAVLHSTAAGFANEKNRWIFPSGAMNV